MVMTNKAATAGIVGHTEMHALHADPDGWLRRENVDEYVDELYNGTTGGIFILVLGDDVKFIAQGAFQGIPYLEELVINAGTEYIGKNACADMRYLRIVVIPNSVKIIDDFAFDGCSALDELPNGLGGVEYIGASAFRDCYSLEELTIPASTDTIESGAFRHCRSLGKVTFEQHSQLRRLGDKAFAENRSLMFLPKGIPAGVKRAYVKDAFRDSACMKPGIIRRLLYKHRVKLFHYHRYDSRWMF